MSERYRRASHLLCINNWFVDWKRERAQCSMAMPSCEVHHCDTRNDDPFTAKGEFDYSEHSSFLIVFIFHFFHFLQMLKMPSLIWTEKLGSLKG